MSQYQVTCYLDTGAVAEEKRNVLVDADDPFEARCKAKNSMEQAGMDVKAVGPAVREDHKDSAFEYDAESERITVDAVFLFLLLFRLGGMGLGQMRSFCNDRERAFMDLVIEKGRELHPVGIENFKDENDAS